MWQGSAAQQTAELVPKGVSVVGAFHNVSADVLNGDEDVDCDVIVCSDDAAATQVAMELAVKIPRVRAIDGGKLENARIVEQITALLIGLNIRHKGHSGVRITVDVANFADVAAKAAAPIGAGPSSSVPDLL